MKKILISIKTSLCHHSDMGYCHGVLYGSSEGHDFMEMKEKRMNNELVLCDLLFASFIH